MKKLPAIVFFLLPSFLGAFQVQITGDTAEIVSVADFVAMNFSGNAHVGGGELSVSGDRIEIDTTPNASAAAIGEMSALGEIRATGNAHFSLKTCSGSADKIIITPGEKIVKLLGAAELVDDRIGRVHSDSLVFNVETGRVVTEVLNSGRSRVSIEETAQLRDMIAPVRGNGDE
jgi:lipopolysaccharide export system protein LptA